MRVQLALLALTAALLATVGCGGAKKDPGTPPATVPAPQEEASAPETEESSEMTLTGTLGKTVEAGGWILKTSDKTYLLLTIAEYRWEAWFKEGARLKVTGNESPDTVSIFMQGIPFKVNSMEPM